jgi:hypothetical protein
MFNEAASIADDMQCQMELGDMVGWFLGYFMTHELEVY